MKKGRSKSIRSSRPVEIAHGRTSCTTESTEQFAKIDLALEGQMALIMALQWVWVVVTPSADADNDVYDYIGILSMDENFKDNFSTDIPATLDDEETIAYFRHSFQNVITTSGQTVLPHGKTEWQHFEDMGGILVPETLGMGQVINDGGSVTHSLDIMVYYKRIEKPTPQQLDYLYRRR